MLQQYEEGEIEIYLMKGDRFRGDLQGDQMDPNAHYWLPNEDGLNCRINDERNTSDKVDYHYFRDKNVNVTIQPYWCDDENGIVDYCFNKTIPFDRPTIYFKKFNLHIYTNGGIINVRDVILDGSEAIYECKI